VPVAGPWVPGGDASRGAGQRHPKAAREVCSQVTGPVAPQEGAMARRALPLRGLVDVETVLNDDQQAPRSTAAALFNVALRSHWHSGRGQRQPIGRGPDGRLVILEHRASELTNQ